MNASNWCESICYSRATRRCKLIVGIIDGGHMDEGSTLTIAN